MSPPQMSPLHWAADSGHVDTVKCLVEKGANLHSKDVFGVRECDCTTDCKIHTMPGYDCISYHILESV